jgi:putative ABC transport system permease protein
VALGGTSAAIMRFVLPQCLVLVATGLTLGLVGVIVMRTLIAAHLYDLHPFDPRVIGGVALLLGITALAACAVPMRRAANVDPMVALRPE